LGFRLGPAFAEAERFDQELVSIARDARALLIEVLGAPLLLGARSRDDFLERRDPTNRIEQALVSVVDGRHRLGSLVIG
jgi:hypothetical protein